MAQATLEKRRAGRSPAEVLIDKVWRFFCSVRAAVVEIIVLAVLVLIGTLRGSSVPQWIADAIPPLQPVVDRWYDWDVFHSLPFMGILAVLCVAIIVCTLNRVPGIWKTISNPTVRTTRGFLYSADLSAAGSTSGTIDDAVSSLTHSFEQRRYRVLTETVGDDVHVYADKNRWAKLGTFPFHLALILMLVGGIVGARYGFRDNSFIIPEGSIRSVGHGTGLSVGLDQFTDSWREDGTPQEYRSDLVLYKNGEPVKAESITVNNPMTYGSITIYQSSFGQAASFLVTDSDGRVLFDDSIPLGQFRSTANPDAPAGLQQLAQVGMQLNIIAPDEDRPNEPELDTLDLSSGEMFVQIRDLTPYGDEERPSAIVGQGETVTIGDLNVTFVRERSFTLLQVASNPGMPIFWTAAFLLVGGLAITFYFPLRRIRGIVTTDQKSHGSTFMIAPLAKRDWSGKRDFETIVKALETEPDNNLEIQMTRQAADEPDSGERE